FRVRRAAVNLGARDESHAAQRAGDLRRVTLDHALEELWNSFLHVTRQQTDRAEVDEHDASIVAHENVARMWIGVIHTVDKDHLAIRGEYALGKRGAIDPAALELGHIGDLRGFDQLRRQHLLRRGLFHDDRELDHRIVLEMRRDERDVVRLLSEIELVTNHGADLTVIRLDAAYASEE